MLQSIRDKLVGWVAWAIVIIIGVPFAILGVTDFGSPSRSLSVAEVDDMVVELDDYQQRYQYRRQTMQQQLGANYRPDKFDQVIQKQVLNEMVEEKLLDRLVEESNIYVGNDELSVVIKNDPGFFKDGKFSFDVYKNRIGQLGYTPDAYEASLRKEQRLSAIPRLVRSSSFVTEQEEKRYNRLLMQQRQVDYLVIEPDRFPEDIEITEEDVQAYFDEHRSQFIRPEQIKLEYVRLSASQLSSRIEVTEDAVRQHYESNADLYVVDEQRKASHILVNLTEGKTLDDSPEVSKKISEIQGKLAAGEKFEDLAKDYSDDPGSAQSGGDLGQVLRGVMVPPFEKALFSMQKVGQISEPVVSSFGVHLIRLDGITPRQAKAYEEVRDQVRDSYAEEQAVNLYYDISERLAELTHENPDSLVPVAEGIDLPLETTDWIGRKGQEFGIASNQDVLREAFSEQLKKSRTNSDPVETGVNEVVIFRVADSRPSVQLSLEEARKDVTEAATKAKQKSRLEKYAQQLVGKILAGKSVQDISRNEKLELQKSVVLNRDSKDAPSALVRNLFKMPVPENDKPVIQSISLGGNKLAVVIFSQLIEPEDMQAGTGMNGGLGRRMAAKDAGNFLSEIRQGAKVTIHKDKL